MGVTQGINKFDTVYLDSHKPEMKYINEPWEPEYTVFVPHEARVSTLDIITHELINRRLINEALFPESYTIW